MKRHLLSTLVIATVCGAALTSCGRKGALEPPPSTIIQDENGRDIQRPVPDKPFILDRLIK